MAFPVWGAVEPECGDLGNLSLSLYTGLSLREPLDNWKEGVLETGDQMKGIGPGEVGIRGSRA